ncbi:MAG: RimK family alpha-L-glutamate ligase [Patescibacteria group bacterium]|nr:RimK family alpha-L-glutamate ligase [Patescibacteria group bacterium]
MKKIKFAIIGASETENTKDLVKEIEKRRHKAYLIQPKNLVFEFSKNNKFKVSQGKIDLDKLDVFIFRGYTINIVPAKILAEKLVYDKKVVIDEVLGKKFVPSKIFESSQFARHEINHPKTFQALDFKSYENIFNSISFPIIVKPVYGQKGQDVIKINSKAQARKFFRKNPNGYLIQEFLKTDSDTRVFVVNNKVIGAIRRFVLPGDFRSNASLGAKAEKIIPTKEMKETAIKATKVMGYEISGVDFIKYRNKYYVLEVNSTPQWQKFKEVTGVNPAKNIISLALKKYKRSNIN